jgi:hypothetical protein
MAPWRRLHHVHIRPPGRGSGPLSGKRNAHGVAKRFGSTPKQTWVPEGNLAGFCVGAFLKSGRPRGPGRALKSVEGFAPQF